MGLHKLRFTLFTQCRLQLLNLMRILDSYGKFCPRMSGLTKLYSANELQQDRSSTKPWRCRLVIEILCSHFFCFLIQFEIIHSKLSHTNLAIETLFQNVIKDENILVIGSSTLVFVLPKEECTRHCVAQNHMCTSQVLRNVLYELFLSFNLLTIFSNILHKRSKTKLTLKHESLQNIEQITM